MKTEDVAFKRAGARLRQIFIDHTTNPDTKWVAGEAFYEAAIRDACGHASLIPYAQAKENARFDVELELAGLRDQVANQKAFIKELQVALRK